MPVTVLVTPSDTIDPDLQRRILADRLGDVAFHVAASRDRADVEAAASEVDPDALVVGDAHVTVDGALLDRCPSLRVVGKCGIGVGHIDVAAADAAGAVVLNAPTYCTEEVSTHALTLVLSAVRKVRTYDRAVRAGEWDWRTGRPLRRVADLTLGFSSFGRIAREVAAKARPLGVEMVAADPYVDGETVADHGVDPVDFEGLLARADVVSVHTPLTPETRGLFDAAAFESMRDGAFLVNTGRGPVVDEGDLYDALTAGELAGAALDVMPTEPATDSPLFDLESVTVTPHVAWYSEASRRELSESVARDVARVLAGESPDSVIDPAADWL